MKPEKNRPTPAPTRRKPIKETRRKRTPLIAQPQIRPTQAPAPSPDTDRRHRSDQHAKPTRKTADDPVQRPTGLAIKAWQSGFGRIEWIEDLLEREGPEGLRRRL